MLSPQFFGQKPVAFDGLSGSITVPSLPGRQAAFQFCVRDATSSRQDLLAATGRLRDLLKEAQARKSNPLALLLVGSMERGSKVRRKVISCNVWVVL